MWILLRPLLAAAAACLLLSGPAAAEGRAVTLDDVLGMRTFGSMAVSPDGRWLVYERQGPWASSPRFDRGWRSGWASSELMIVETGGRHEPVPLLAGDDAGGGLVGVWSPDSARLLIYRLSGDRLEAGVVSLADRSVHWTGLTPDLPTTGSAAAWLGSDRLALTIRPDGSLPWMLRFDGTGQAVMDGRWRATAQGAEPSRSVFDTEGGGATPEDVAPPLRLVRLDLETGETRMLAEGAIRDIAAAPDGKVLAVLKQAEITPLVPAERAVQLAILRRGRLALISAVGGAPVDIPDLDVGPHLLRWSADSRQLLVWARRDDQAWNEGALRRIRRDGTAAVLEAEGLTPFGPGRSLDEIRPVRAEWMGDAVLVYARSVNGERFDWWALGGGAPTRLTHRLTTAPPRLAAVESRGVLMFADGGLWRMTRAGVRRLSKSDAVVAQGEPDDQRKPIRLRSNDTPRRNWAVSALDGRAQVIDETGAVALASRQDACGGFAWPRAVARNTVALVCKDQGVETLWLTTRQGSRRIDQLNGQFAALALPQPLAIPHADRWNKATGSFLYLPAGLAPSAVKGVLVHIYPGRAEDGAYVDASFLRGAANPQMLTTGGYAVLSVGIAEEGQSRRDTLFEDFVIGVNRAVDAALAAYPDLPADRMVLIGHSFGGYAALSVAERSGRFRGCISWSGPTDMFGMWGEFSPHSLIWPEEQFTPTQSIGATESGQAGLMDPPWKASETYVDASPYLQSDRIQAPVLLITADRDYVPMSQAERLFTALHRQGKSAKLIVYWGEGHDIASPANLRDVYDEVFGWLGQALTVRSVRPSGSGEPPRP